MAGQLRNAFDRIATETTLGQAVTRLGEILTRLGEKLTVEVDNHPAEYPLPPNQVNELRAPEHPSEYPLPGDQVQALTPPAPEPINFPTEYPLPQAQAEALADFPDVQTDALTNAELRAAPLSVDTGINQPLQDGGTVQVGNLPDVYPDGHLQPLTDDQLRLAPLETITTVPDVVGVEVINPTVMPDTYPLPQGQVETLTPPVSVEAKPPQVDRLMEQVAIGNQQKPRYIGSAPPGAETHEEVWRIDRFTWSTGPAGDLYPSVIETRIGAWDDRSTLF